MLSRLLWIGLAIVALVGGLLFQNRWIFHDGLLDARPERMIEGAVADRMTVVGADGRAVYLPRDTKLELQRAVRELIAAKTQLAMLRARHADAAEVAAAQQRSDRASAEMDRVRERLDRHEHLSRSDRDALRTHIQQQVRQAVREKIHN